MGLNVVNDGLFKLGVKGATGSLLWLNLVRWTTTLSINLVFQVNLLQDKTIFKLPTFICFLSNNWQ